MKSKRIIWSPLVFGLAALCFLLPFITVSCSGTKLITVTGLDLVTGSRQINTGSGFNMEVKGGNNKIDRELFAILAFLLALGGLVLALLRKVPAKILGLISAAGTVCMLLLYRSLNHQATVQGEGVKVEFEPGFWLTIVVFIAGIVLHFLPMADEKPTAVQGEVPPPPAPPAQPTP